jgi:hypothetical protein
MRPRRFFLLGVLYEPGGSPTATFLKRRKLDFVVAAKLILLVDVRGEEVDVSPLG